MTEGDGSEGRIDRPDPADRPVPPADVPVSGIDEVGASGATDATGATDVIGDEPDAREVIVDLRRRLAVEREVALNAVDAVLGAQAEAAQVRAENKELFYRLHVREVELEQLKELLGPAPHTAGSAEGSTAERDAAAGETGSDLGWAARSLVRAARATVRRP